MAKKGNWPKPSDTDCAYLAGLFDGEGTLTLRFRQHHASMKVGAWILTLSITNTHAPTIRHIKDVLGFGWVRLQSRRTVSHRPVYTWGSESNGAETFLRWILPFTVTKRSQIELALEGIRIRKESPRIALDPEKGNYRSVSIETHIKLQRIRQDIKDLNGHKSLTRVV